MNVKHHFFSALLVLLLAGSQSLTAEEVKDKQPSLLDTEALGGLHYGMTKAAAFKYLAAKPTLGEMEYWGGDGAMHQPANFVAGVKLDLVSDTETSPQIVESIEVEAPSTLSTKKGIHIGSSEAELIAAYKERRDAENSKAGSVFIAGSVYGGGLMFSIEKGKVVKIFIGVLSMD